LEAILRPAAKGRQTAAAGTPASDHFMNRTSRLSNLALPLLVVTLIASPLLYFLSFGPALLLLDQKILDKHQVSTFYLPVIASQHYAPPLFAAAKWYAGLWVDPERL
jgi:hypothetical protein